MENTGKCFCLPAFANGCAEKSFENEHFAIFGKLVEDSSILVRYHNSSLEECPPTLCIKYNGNDGAFCEMQMAKCEHGKENDFCLLIALKDNFSISICVKDIENTNLEMKIGKDPLKEIVRRYNLDLNPLLLPVKKESIFSFKEIIEKVIYSFKKIFHNI